MDPNKLRELALFIVPLLLSLSFHEMCHAWAAYKLGDDTGRLLGRLTMNPLPHIDPIGTIVFPISSLFMGGGMLFGWAKPVPVNSLNLKGDHRKSLLWVSLMGPLSNFLLAFVSTILFALIIKFFPNMNVTAAQFLLGMLGSAILLNLTLCFFNLIPIPPLDGFGVLTGLVPRNLAETLESLAPYGFLLLLLMWYTGIAGFIGAPIRLALHWLLYLGSTLFQISLFPYFPHI